MVSRLTRNQLPGNRLRVRLPCPPPEKVEQNPVSPTETRGFLFILEGVFYWKMAAGNVAQRSDRIE